MIINKNYKLYFFSILFTIIALVIGVGYYFLNSLDSKYGNINITNIEEKDKIYSRTTYCDYYFRIMSYDSNRKFNGSYSMLIPKEVDLGYEIEDNNITTFLFKNKMTFIEPFDYVVKDPVKDEKYIEKLIHFSNEFSKILVLKDQNNFKKVKEDSERIFRKLYDRNISLKLQKVEDYHTKIEVGLPNIDINYLKDVKWKVESHIKNDFEQDSEIVKWRYGSSTMTFQYLQKIEKDIIEKIVNWTTYDALIVKTIKIGESTATPMYINIEKSEKKITAYYESVEGGVYALILDGNSEKVVLENIIDFMKIAYGITVNDNPDSPQYITFCNSFREQNDKNRIAFKSKNRNGQYEKRIKELESKVEESRKKAENSNKTDGNLFFDTPKTNKLEAELKSSEAELETVQECFRNGEDDDNRGIECNWTNF